MKKVILLFLLLICVFVKNYAQKNDCSDIYEAAKQEADSIGQPDYQKAINLLTTLRKCLDSFKNANQSLKDSADKLNERIFKEVNEAKNEAIKQRDRANLATKKAVFEANNVTALYLTSESDKLLPQKAMKLLEVAGTKKIDRELRKTVQNKVIERFKNSNLHYFRQISQFELPIGFAFAVFSPKNTFLICCIEEKIPDTEGILITNRKFRILESKTGKENILFKGKLFSKVQFTKDEKYIKVAENYFGEKIYKTDDLKEIIDKINIQFEDFAEFGFDTSEEFDLYLQGNNYSRPQADTIFNSFRKSLNYLETNNNVITESISNDKNTLFIRFSDFVGKIYDNSDKPDNYPNIVEKKQIENIEFSVNSKYLMYKTGNIHRILDVNNLSTPYFLNPKDSIVTVELSPKRNILVVDFGNKKKIWDLASDPVKPLLQNIQDSIQYIRFTQDGDKLFTFLLDSFDFKIWSENGEAITDSSLSLGDFFSDETYSGTYGGFYKYDSASNSVLQKKFYSKQLNDYEDFKNKELHQSNKFEILVNSVERKIIWTNRGRKVVKEISQNEFLFIEGNAIFKLNKDKLKNSSIAYSNLSPLDYTFEEIQEWKKVFGEKYLLPLDDDLKKKYNIK